MNTPLQQAAQAVINQCEVEALWASYPWLGAKLAELRKALDAEITQSVEPYAVFQGLVDSGEHGAFNLDLLKMIPRGAYLYLHQPKPQATTPVPEGYVLVPIEATPAMDNAYRKSPCRDLSGLWHEIITAAQGEKK